MIDLMIDIKQQMLIARGYPKNAITKPIMKSMNGTTNAFFTAKASDRYSWSGLISSKDFAIQNNMILTRQVKKKDYLQQMWLNKEVMK